MRRCALFGENVSTFPRLHHALEAGVEFRGVQGLQGGGTPLQPHTAIGPRRPAWRDLVRVKISLRQNAMLFPQSRGIDFLRVPMNCVNEREAQNGQTMPTTKYGELNQLGELGHGQSPSNAADVVPPPNFPSNQGHESGWNWGRCTHRVKLRLRPAEACCQKCIQPVCQRHPRGRY